MDATTAALVGWTAGISTDQLSETAVHAVRRSFVDSIGCAFGAYRRDAMAALRNLADQSSSRSPATVVGTTIATTPDSAAFTNSAMIRYLDFSDDYFGGTGSIGPHPSDNIGGVLAAAEMRHVSGKDFALGVVVAYEVVGQVVDNITMPPGRRHWDYTVLHAMGTSLGAGRVMGLHRAQLASALGIAAVANLSVQQSRHGAISDWKGLAGPDGSSRGLHAAVLAAAGITGPDEPFEGGYGVHDLLRAELPLPELGGGDRRYRIEDTFFKVLPVRYNSQLPIWAAIELRERLADKGASLDDITAVRVDLVQRYVTTREESPASWDPQTGGTADHSFAYLVAAALVDGEVTKRTLTAERFRDPAILSLLQRVELRANDAFTAAFPKTFNTRIEVELANGDVITVHRKDPKGVPANPMSDDEIGEKFLRQASEVLPEARAREVLERLWEFDQLADIAELLPALVLPEH